MSQLPLMTGYTMAGFILGYVCGALMVYRVVRRNLEKL